MDSLYILIPIALILVTLAVAIFFWAVNSGQFEDLDREASRILFENKDNNVKNSNETDHV